jgi:hypothetical protein
MVAKKKLVVKKKKVIKKKPAAKKKILKKKKPVARKKAVLKKRRPVSKKPAPKVPAEKPLGKVTHYFPHVQAGVIKITKNSLEVGQTIRIKGHTTDFSQVIESMQVDHVPVTKADKGAEIGLKVKSRVRNGDLVFKK